MTDRRAADSVGEALFARIVADAPDAIAVQDMTARIEWVNPACERLYGWSLAEVRGRKPLDFILPPEARPDPAPIARFRYDPDSGLFGRDRLGRHMRRDGTTFWTRQSFELIDPGPGPGDRRVVITCRDVTGQVSTETVLRQVQVDLRHAAQHDDLTGRANRKRLGAHLAAPALRARIRARRVGVLVIDIDKFKDINDTLGHGAGDRTLCHVAEVLARVAGPGDLACRTGGTSSCSSASCPGAQLCSTPAPERCCARSSRGSRGRSRPSASAPPSGPARRARGRPRARK